MLALEPFIAALYYKVARTSMEVAKFNLFTKTKNPNVMALPPTSVYFLQHALRAHLQVMLLWIAADKQASPALSANIIYFG